MAIFAMNSGAGRVVGGDRMDACVNIQAFVADLVGRGIEVVMSCRSDLDAKSQGRFGFQLVLRRGGSERLVEVLMPGLPLERVRYMDLPGQDIWSFPRLYIDGSSWLWKFALDVCIPENS